VIRVLLADDQALIRAGFRVLIDTAGDLQVVGEATDGQQAVDLARRERADVVLMDIRMPGVDGLEATRRISADEDLAGVKVIILTTFESDEYVYQALRAGASGFLVKDTEPADLIQAVRVVARGDALLSPSVTRRLITDIASRPERPPPSDRALASLTDRERQVMALVAEGLSNDEIAARLFLSPLTSKTHVSRIMTKLNARDRAQLVVLAYETGLVTPGGRDRHPRPRLASRRLRRRPRPSQGAQSDQHEFPSAVGVGLRLSWRLPWRVTSDSAGRRLAGLGHGARRHDRERDRDG
jgi:DNA-binding NarL/FixJ family response regulator